MLEKKNFTYVILKPNLNTNLKQNLNYLKPKLLKLLNWNKNWKRNKNMNKVKVNREKNG